MIQCWSHPAVMGIPNPKLAPSSWLHPTRSQTPIHLSRSCSNISSGTLFKILPTRRHLDLLCVSLQLYWANCFPTTIPQPQRERKALVWWWCEGGGAEVLWVIPSALGSKMCQDHMVFLGLPELPFLSQASGGSEFTFPGDPIRG